MTTDNEKDIELEHLRGLLADIHTKTAYPPISSREADQANTIAELKQEIQQYRSGLLEIIHMESCLLADARDIATRTLAVGRPVQAED